MFDKEYIKADSEENFVKASPTSNGWELGISYLKKSLKYGLSDGNKEYWKKKQAKKMVDMLFDKGIENAYKEEHKRQYGY